MISRSTCNQQGIRRNLMYEPLMQPVSRDVVVILQDGGERAAVRRAVRMQVIAALGEEASAEVLEGVKEKGSKATSYLQEAIQGAMAAVEEAAAKLREKATELAEKSRKALQSLIERLKGSPQGIGGGVR
jgi:hypothetical protein